MTLTPTVDPGLSNSKWPAATRRIFGLTLASDFPFASRLAQGAGPPDLTFACAMTPPVPIKWEQATPDYASLRHTEDGESTAYLYRFDTCEVLRFPRVADFYLWPDRIICHVLDPAQDYMVEIRLLGMVLAFWLEWQGFPALHAGVVVVGSSAAAFLSHSRGGKSVLAAALMQAGYPLLTDDILPIECRRGSCVGRPGYPQLRLWPDEAQHFLGHYQDLERVHPAHPKRRVPVGPNGFGAFCDKSQPLACIYLPQRSDPAEGRTKIEITAVSARDAVIELLRYSFAARMAEAVGLAPQRLDFFARMARQVPMRRLVYPSGFEHLPRVREAILEDLERWS